MESLPAEVQKDIDSVRAACRERAGPNQPSLSSGDERLAPFTVSGVQAVMINYRDLCGGECYKGDNCSNRESCRIIIYTRSGNACREALSTEADGPVFLSVDGLKDYPPKFNALVLSVYGGNKDCPTRDVVVPEGKERHWSLDPSLEAVLRRHR